MQVVGDDYLVTNAARVRQAAEVGACTRLLIKPNQAGTLTEPRPPSTPPAPPTADIVSARSGETEDVSSYISPSVGGRRAEGRSFTRSERMAKWNEGLRIAEVVGGDLAS